MSDLVSTPQIAADFGISEELVSGIVANAKLKTSRLVVGSEPIILFEKAEAIKVIQAYIDAAKAEEQRKRAEAEAAREPTMKEVMAKLKGVAADISDVAELHEEIKRLTVANHGIFKALTDFKAETQERLSGLKTLLVSARDEINALKKGHTTAEQAGEPAGLKKVAVIGVSKTYHPRLHELVAGKIELKLIDPHDIRGIYMMRKHDVVLAMRKFTDMRHADQMKSAKITPVYVDGGIESLEVELDALAS